MALQYLCDAIRDMKRFRSLQQIAKNLIEVDPGWESSKPEEDEAISRAVLLYGPGVNIYFSLIDVDMYCVVEIEWIDVLISMRRLNDSY